MKHETFGDIDIYAVGLLADLRDFAHSPQPLASRLRTMRLRLGYPARQARARNWRAVKNYLNGYLCEPAVFPPGVTRCGTGWTRGRAYRDLIQRAERAATTKETDPR